MRPSKNTIYVKKTKNLYFGKRSSVLFETSKYVKKLNFCQVARLNDEIMQDDSWMPDCFSTMPDLSQIMLDQVAKMAPVATTPVGFHFGFSMISR